MRIDGLLVYGLCGGTGAFDKQRYVIFSNQQRNIIHEKFVIMGEVLYRERVSAF